MRSPWLQLLLLFLYLLLVLFVSKLLDFVLWYQHGMLSTQLLDPLVLSVRQLKLLLDSRGVSYADFYEKHDLVKLLEDSGDVMSGEMDHVRDTVIPLKDRLKTSPAVSFFSGGAHFYEEVEDTRDGVWLVQVITSGEALLDDYKWSLVCSQLAPFAIRMGIFDCRRDQRHCEKKGWKQPLLLLAMPKGTKPKDKVVVQPFISNEPQAIVDWVRHQLSSWVKIIHNIDEVHEDWLRIDGKEEKNKSGNDNKSSVSALNSISSNGVRVLLLSQLLHPPLFLAALSIKFTGRIRFGMFTVKKEESDSVQKLLKLPVKKLPCYLVITPEKTLVYGHQRLEYFNLWSMNAFLRGIQPEMNDVFLCSLILVNMLVSISVFMVPAQFWWKWAVNCLWILVSYNLWLFSVWLLILAAARSAAYNVVVDRLLTIFRVFGLSSFGSVIRIEWVHQFYNPTLFIACFAFYVVLMTLAIRKWAPAWLSSPPSNSEREMRAWWEVLPLDSYWVNYLFSPMASLSRPIPQPQVELEDGIDLLIERLAVPNFWLQPVISVDYIKDLPFWQYRGWDVVNESPSASSSGSVNCVHLTPKLLERIMDGEEPMDFICICSQDQTRLRSCTSPKVGTSVSKMDCTSDVPCSCLKASSTSTPVNVKTAFATSETSHSCHGNSKSMSSCDCEHAFCRQKRGSCQSCVWRDDVNNSTSENEQEDSDIDIGWKAPEGVLPTTDCAVCLEGYRYGTVLCALPCGHNYHQRCILAWLQRDNHHCPVCRWPAYRSRSTQIHLHLE